MITHLAGDSQMHVLSYAIDNNNILAWIELLGASSGIDRIWANLVQNKVQEVVNPTMNQYSYLSLDRFLVEEGAKVVRRDIRIKNTWTDHVVLINNVMFEHNHKYMYWDMKLQEGHFIDKVRQIVDVPVFPEWEGYLWNAALAEPNIMYMMTRALNKQVVYIKYDPKWWTEAISQGLKNGLIKLEVQA